MVVGVRFLSVFVLFLGLRVVVTVDDGAVVVFVGVPILAVFETAVGGVVVSHMVVVVGMYVFRMLVLWFAPLALGVLLYCSLGHGNTSGDAGSVAVSSQAVGYGGKGIMTKASRRSNETFSFVDPRWLKLPFPVS